MKSSQVTGRATRGVPWLLQWRSFRETEDPVVMSIRVLVNEDVERIGEVVVRGLPQLFLCLA